MSYDNTLTIKLPFSLADIASRIGRALDPDVGGDKSFTRIVTGQKDGKDIYGDTISMTTPCTTMFKDQARYLLANPVHLQAMVAQDYAKRWVGLKAPSLDECIVFCKGVIPEPPVTGRIL